MCVMRKGLAEKVKLKNNRKPGTHRGGTNIFKELNLNLCYMEMKKNDSVIIFFRQEDRSHLLFFIVNTDWS